METADVHGLVPQDRSDHLRHALVLAGIDDAGIETRPASPGSYQLHDETLHRDAAGARRGLVVGAVVGALVGLALGLLLPAIEGAGAVAVTIATVAGFGGLVGAMAGLQGADSLDADPVTYCAVTDDDAYELVRVHHEHWHHRAHRIMEQHDAVFLQCPVPVAPEDTLTGLPTIRPTEAPAS